MTCDDYKEAYEIQGFGPQNKRIKKLTLKMWMMSCMPELGRPMPVTSPSFTKAQELAAELGYPDFKCSNG